MEKRVSLSCGDLSRRSQEEDNGESSTKINCDQTFTFNRFMGTLNCEMCINYESRLQLYQEIERRLRQQLTTLQNMNEQNKMELSMERLKCKEMDSKIETLQSSVTRSLQETNDLFRCVEIRVRDAQVQLEKEIRSVQSRLTDLTNDRRRVQENFEHLRKKYDDLLNRHKKSATQLQNEQINLPQTVDELHLLCLQLREELIENRMVEEHLKETLVSDLNFVKLQFESEIKCKNQLEATLSEDVDNLRTKLAIAQSQLKDQQTLLQWKTDTEERVEGLQRKVDHLENALKTGKVDKEKLEESLRESQNRAQSLQKELDNCVQVQRDFVHLSQSLQMQLEKIRQSEHEIRWEDDDDVLMCRGCKQVFSRQRRKVHCRHCGRIFCDTCLFRTVPSGSQKKPAKVCEVCHTLLVRDTAPYFSVQVPHSQLDGLL